MDKRQKQLGEEGIRDPSNYRRMSEPFESPEQCQEEMEAFLNAVYELRNKHRIANVFMVVQMNILVGGEETTVMSPWSCGDESLVEIMASYGYGYANARRWEVLAKVRKQATDMVEKVGKSRS